MTLRSRVGDLKPSTLLIITAVIVVLTVCWVLWRADTAEDNSSERVDKAEFKVEKQADRITVLEDYVTLCREQPKECQKVVPPVEDIEPKVTRQTVFQQPAFNQVMTAVRILLPAGISQFCAGGRCDGKPGTNGTNGTNGADAPAVTAEQIGAAVAAYCNANDGCAGPGPTSEQIAEAVADYCEANNGCRPEEEPEPTPTPPVLP